MKPMAYRKLDLTLISAKDLNLEGKKYVYAEVSLSGDPCSRQHTKIHVDSGPNPTLNQTLSFNVPADSGTLHIVLRTKKKVLGNKDIGDVHVPLKELLGDKGDVTYPVRVPSSENPIGVINLSYNISWVIAKLNGAIGEMFLGDKGFGGGEASGCSG